LLSDTEIEAPLLPFHPGAGGAFPRRRRLPTLSFSSIYWLSSFSKSLPSVFLLLGSNLVSRRLPPTGGDTASSRSLPISLVVLSYLKPDLIYVCCFSAQLQFVFKSLRHLRSASRPSCSTMFEETIVVSYCKSKTTVLEILSG